jgi:hypothetical protein
VDCGEVSRRLRCRAIAVVARVLAGCRVMGQVGGLLRRMVLRGIEGLADRGRGRRSTVVAEEMEIGDVMSVVKGTALDILMGMPGRVS